MNGPALAVRGSKVAIAWFTQSNDKTPSVKLITSNDGGQTFDPPRIVAVATPIGRVDTTVLADGSTLVLWIATADKTAEIRVRRYPADGNPSLPITIATVANTRSSGFPQIAAIEDAALVAWTGDDRRVHTAVISLN